MEKVEERTQELGRKIDKTSRKKIEYRGLEAWTSVGAAKVKIIKESAVEAVWNEQSRQWDAGVNNVDKIREVYQVVSRASQQTAQDRGFSDELIAKRIRQLLVSSKPSVEERNASLMATKQAQPVQVYFLPKGGIGNMVALQDNPLLQLIREPSYTVESNRNVRTAGDDYHVSCLQDDEGVSSFF